MPRPSLLTCASLVLALAGSARAASSPPGVNIRWDNCYADGGALNRTFACDTNTGSERLIISFELDTEMEEMSGIEIYMDLGAAAVTLPAWWQFRNAGTCRQTSLNMNVTLPNGAVNCEDWSSGQAASGIGAYTIGSLGPQTAEIRAAAAVPASALAHLFPGIEYYAVTLTISHAKTVGTGACGGCETPMCIFASTVRLTTPVVGGGVVLNRGANSDSQYATWQNGQPTDVHRGPCFFPLGELCQTFHQSFSCVLSTTPTRSSTWGAVKSLYR